MIYIIIVGEWIVDYIYVPHPQLGFDRNLALQWERGIARVVKYPHANHQQTEQKILVFVVLYIHIPHLGPLKHENFKYIRLYGKCKVLLSIE